MFAKKTRAFICRRATIVMECMHQTVNLVYFYNATCNDQEVFSAFTKQSSITVSYFILKGKHLKDKDIGENGLA